MRLIVLNYRLLSIVMVIVLSLSCSRQNIEVPERGLDNDITIETARSWFDKKSDQKQGARLKTDKFNGLTPNWEKAQLMVSNQGEKHVEVPLEFPSNVKWYNKYQITDDNGKKKSVNKAQEFWLVVYNGKEGEKEDRVKEIQPEKEYMDVNRGIVSTYNFTGRVLLWSWSGEILGGSYYKDGAKTHRIEQISSSKSEKARVIYCDPYTYCSWTSFCFSDGGTYELFATSNTVAGTNCWLPPVDGERPSNYSCGSWISTGTSTYQQCYDTGTPAPGGTPNIPGTGTIDIDVSRIKSGCIYNAYNSLLNANLKSRVLNIIKDFNQSKNITIEIIDEDLHDSTIDGTTRPTNVANNVYEIALNSAVLNNSSQDYIAATIIHEMIHVYLPANDGNTDHEVMAEKYVNPMAFALKAAGYALTFEDAVALSWGGLQKTKAWRQLLDIDRVAGTTVTQKILNTNSNYRNSTGYGLRCH